MKKVFTVLAGLLFLTVIAQFFLAASGAFDNAPVEEAFQPHRMLGYTIFVLAIVVVIVGAIARMPGRIIGIAGVVVGLVLLQVAIAEIAEAVGAAGHIVFGLHALNALAIGGASETVVQRSRKLAWRPKEAGRSEERSRSEGPSRMAS